jgi:glycosyltransferase involved in cell wall biosynthesis
MVHNEADRYLPSLLRAWGSWADNIVLLDDNSTDNLEEVVGEYNRATILVPNELQANLHRFRRSRSADAAWGAESPARAELWTHAVERGDDWIFVLDADMCPAADPTPLFNTDADAIAFRLYDLWGPGIYREDQFWNAHNVARVWAVRNPHDVYGVWPDRGLHCGHFPSDLKSPNGVILAPRKYALLHYAYATPEDRVAKYDQYKKEVEQLEGSEGAHAESIIDPAPVLRKLHRAIPWRIVKGAGGVQCEAGQGSVRTVLEEPTPTSG